MPSQAMISGASATGLHDQHHNASSDLRRGAALNAALVSSEIASAVDADGQIGRAHV